MDEGWGEGRVTDCRQFAQNNPPDQNQELILKFGLQHIISDRVR
jgi:hypothetical protein